MATKICTRCSKTKDETEFYKRSSSKDGRQSKCKDCAKAATRDSYGRNALAIKGRLRPYMENWAEGGRRCTTCQEWKVWDRFGLVKSGHNGRSARCTDCLNADRRNARKDAPRPSGIAPNPVGIAAFDRMATEQGGRCAVCPAKPRHLVADCEPWTGRLRQLLCVRCHDVLLVIEQNPGLLDDLRAYVEMHQEVGDNRGQHDGRGDTG